MNSSLKGGKSKSSKSSSSKSKKGGNFLGSVSELFVPTGWESFATAAGLLAIDRADAAFRRSRNSSKKQKGGADMDGHETFEHMNGELDNLQQDTYNPDMMSGGGPKKNVKSKSKSKKPTSKKPTKKPTAKKPASKSKAKGGNFLGAVGDLVAPTGWGPFATAAGLFAIDRADAALRRGTKEKKEKMKGGKKMKGGLCEYEYKHGQVKKTQYNGGVKEEYEYSVCCKDNKGMCMTQSYPSRQTDEHFIEKNLVKNFINLYSNN
jgi:hypothetical protein